MTLLSKYATLFKTATGGSLKYKGLLMSDTDINFDFLLTPEPSTIDSIEYVGPNLNQTSKMTPKKFAIAVLEVFDRLGGASWLMTQAQADSRGFLELLKRMIPKSMQLDDLQGIQINLIDQFGNTVQIQTKGQKDPNDTVNQTVVDAKQTATSGNQNTKCSLSTPEVNITEIFS